jgi:hypothetical protein
MSSAAHAALPSSSSSVARSSARGRPRSSALGAEGSSIGARRGLLGTRVRRRRAAGGRGLPLRAASAASAAPAAAAPAWQQPQPHRRHLVRLHRQQPGPPAPRPAHGQAAHRGLGGDGGRARGGAAAAPGGLQQALPARPQARAALQRALAAGVGGDPVGCGSCAAASAASHRYRSRLSAASSNTASAAAAPASRRPAAAAAARRPLPATRCSQLRGPPMRAGRPATRTAGLPPAARNSSAAAPASVAAAGPERRSASPRDQAVPAFADPLFHQRGLLRVPVGAGAASRAAHPAPTVHCRLGCGVRVVRGLAFGERSCPHCTQANISRLMLRGFRRMGQAWSQALACGRVGGAAVAAVARALAVEGHHQAFGLAIQARLWNRPTAQPKRQNRCRANMNSSVNTRCRWR